MDGGRRKLVRLASWSLSRTGSVVMGRQLDGLRGGLQTSMDRHLGFRVESGADPLDDALTSSLRIKPHSRSVGQEEAGPQPCTRTLASSRKTQTLAKVTGRDSNANSFTDEQRASEGIYTDKCKPLLDRQFLRTTGNLHANSTSSKLLSTSFTLWC